jgi:hypothetical protein
MDQGRQASSEDHAAELPSVPVERDAPLVESNRLQSGESLETVGTAQEDEGWPLTSLQQRLAKTAGRLIKNARYYWLLLSESQVSQLSMKRNCCEQRLADDLTP